MDSMRHALRHGWITRIAVAYLVTLVVLQDGRAFQAQNASLLSKGIRFTKSDPLAGTQMEPTHTWGATFVDYDRDGWSDLLVNRHLRRPLFFRNRGGRFTEADQDEYRDLGYPPRGRTYYDRHSCGWGEANGDARPDLYCVSGAQKGKGTGPNQLLLQTKNGGLEEAADRYGVVDLYGRGRTVEWIDFDRDGKLDIFVGNAFRPGHPNLLFHNTGRGFVSVNSVVRRSMHTRDSSWADWDRNGYPDLLVLSETGHETTAYSNLGGRFTPTSFPGITGQSWMSAAWNDFDGDGWTDVVLNNETRLVVFTNQKGRLIPVQEIGLDQGRMATWLDADNDGDQDLFVVQGSAGRRGATNHRDLLFEQDKGRFRPVESAALGGSENGNGDSAAVADFNNDGRVDVAVTNGYEEGPGGEELEGELDLFMNASVMRNFLKLRLEGGGYNPFGFGARVHVKGTSVDYWYEINDAGNFKSQSDPSVIHLGLGTDTMVEIEIVWLSGIRDCLSVAANMTRKVIRGTHGCKSGG